MHSVVTTEQCKNRQGKNHARRSSVRRTGHHQALASHRGNDVVQERPRCFHHGIIAGRQSLLIFARRLVKLHDDVRARPGAIELVAIYCLTSSSKCSNLSRSAGAALSEMSCCLLCANSFKCSCSISALRHAFKLRCIARVISCKGQI